MATTTNWKNVGNWHWVDKNCLPWAKDYFTSKLGAQTLEKDSTRVTVEVQDVTGDVDLNQRKGKIIHIYDIAINLKWKATDSQNAKEVTGKISIPEFMHDTGIHEIVFDVTLDKDVRENEPVKHLVRESLLPKLRTCFVDFSKDLLQAHAKDVYISPEQMNGHPVLETYKPKPIQNVQETAKGNDQVLGALVNINQKVEFVCSAQDLFQALLDSGRVRVWSRAPADISAKANTKFVLFGGNVTGTIVEVQENKRIQMTWRLKTWPADHHSNVTIDLIQGDESTELKLVQKDVPIGDKDTTEKNWRNYYWNSIKQAFGYGSLL
ncbi:activator of Hsp90 ATPase [Gorgonomyces haynaldii]|nr:activator of Hsp90 ATPase [Gorgonomyces haynaldii]